MGRNTTKNMPEGRPFGHVALIGPPLAGPAHGPGRLNRRRKLTQKGAESPGRPGRPASRARWAARSFGRGVAAGGGRPGLGSLPSPKAAGRRMARTWDGGIGNHRPGGSIFWQPHGHRREEYHCGAAALLLRPLAVDLLPSGMQPICSGARRAAADRAGPLPSRPT